MQCTHSLVKNWDLDCFRIVTKKQAELFRPDREQGVGHKPRLGNLHTNRHQLNLLWESIVWIWPRWTPSGYYPPAQKGLKHLCCSATKSCRNREGLLPEHRWFFLLLKSKCINIDFLFQCSPASSILMTRVPCKSGRWLSSGSMSGFSLKFKRKDFWVEKH